MEPPDVDVTVDFREAALLKVRDQNPKTGTGRWDWAVAALPVGDVLIGDVLLERKTLSDLAASVRDGRWRDQLRRLRDARDSGGYAVGVVVEGRLEGGSGGGFGGRFASSALGWADGGVNGSGGINDVDAHSRLSAGALRTAVLGACFRDGVPVLFTDGPEETAALIERVRGKAASWRVKRSAESEAVGALTPKTSGPLLKRGDGLTPRRLALAQLCAVPGVSPDVAEVMLGLHTTLAGWLASEDASPARLAELRRPGQGQGSRQPRRLGSSLADRVISLLTDGDRGVRGGPPP
jgi:ERCC4-type nuclease